MQIAFIGFGEVGQSLGEELAGASGCTIAAYDLKFSDALSAPSQVIAQSRIARCESAIESVAGASMVISAVTAAATIEAASSAAPAISRDAWYFDLNSASPPAKAEAARLINDAGGRYVEASVMSPINPRRLAAPILLGGPHAASFEPVARTVGFSGAAAYSSEYGKTAAAKLCRSVIIKGMEALMLEALLTARHYGVENDVLTSLEDLIPHPDWRGHANYMISRALLHGVRRAEEMKEAAVTVASAGVDPWMANATVMRQSLAGIHRACAGEDTLQAVLDAMRAGRGDSVLDEERAPQ